ncbi:LacI family DNA-binding transcriptional regulator [Cerasicoccus arenae]|uniref:LacI family transcriptional regulator n=1 Tax=Cerasicoccus arenae TaxID=424488 RepID=A0A8J3GBY6_9BACT|nr:LacI family DNA-binding transcriptional regulator [Cerasicoccus arenae]MBK1858297.1 LacI family DNA-binding transcriptional regulator [Cerasicoccus arenae]GHB90604.1 LacI family transcriptional regulator [Cerasicoccus arenae]
MSSIKEVAHLAGVSTATVSRMMANKSYVSDDTRARVQAAIDELNYQPNRVAQRLREQQSRILGLIVSDIQNPFFSELARSVEKFAQGRGYSVFICNTDEDGAQEQRYLDLMQQEKVAGLIISPTRQVAKRLERLAKSNLPIVTIDRQVDSSFDAVLIDNEDAALRLTERVIASGYQRIAGIFGHLSFTAEERLAGFRKALEAHGMQPHSMLRTPAFENEGYSAMESLLCASGPPDAVVCSSALLATGAYQAVKAAGLELPEAFGFACFDDPAWARCVSPRVTVIRQPTKLIGESAAELLFKRVENGQRSASLIRLQGELVERESLR